MTYKEKKTRQLIVTVLNGALILCAMVFAGCATLGFKPEAPFYWENDQVLCLDVDYQVEHQVPLDMAEESYVPGELITKAANETGLTQWTVYSLPFSGWRFADDTSKITSWQGTLWDLITGDGYNVKVEWQMTEELSYCYTAKYHVGRAYTVSGERLEQMRKEYHEMK